MVALFKSLAVLAVGILPALAQVDTGVRCGDWDTVKVAPYTLYTNLWGKSSSTGSQCSNFISKNGNTVSWKTTWNWTRGSGGVKSYSNVELTDGVGSRQLSSIRSLQSTWNWNQSGSGDVVTNVAYDLFTSTSPGGSNAVEIMIWLANYNAGPISYNWNADGTPKPIVSNLNIAGRAWNLYEGSNGVNQVFSFLPTNNARVTSFSGDINLFVKYLTSNRGLPASQYLKVFQAGTEPTSGSATLTTTSYSASIV